jgi:bifunctional non-homologous end joining protein LigD
MPLDMPPPRTSRFGSPLVLSRVHWVEPRLVVEVKFLTWTEEGLLRQVIYEGVREDKPAEQVGRPQSKPASSKAKPTAPGQRQFPPRQKSLPVPRENILQLLPDAVVPSDEQLAAYWTKVADLSTDVRKWTPFVIENWTPGSRFCCRTLGAGVACPGSA